MARSSVSSRDRLSRYARIATVTPAASRNSLVAAAVAGVASPAIADTYDASSTTPLTLSATANSSFDVQNVMNVASIDFQAFAFFSSIGKWSAGIYVDIFDLGAISTFKLFQGGTQSRLISFGQTPDSSNQASANVVVGNTGSSGALLPASSGFVGFSMKLVNTDIVNGFFEYSWSVSAAGATFTISQWAYNINSAITMPANGGGGGGGAVPGLGGLAALACGAAGMRRNRQRVA